MKRRNIIKAMGGAVAALLGFKPPVAAGKWSCVESLAHQGFEKKVVRAVVCKSMPDGGLKGKAIQGVLSPGFLNKVNKCVNDGVGELLECRVYHVPDRFVDDDGTRDGYSRLPENGYADIA